MKKRPIVFFMLCMSMLMACSSEPDKVEEMRTVKTATGEVSVPVNPERIVVIWNVGDVLAVGAEPVGVSSTIMEYNEMLKPHIPKDAEGSGMEGQVSMEKVLELEPDIIITFNQEAVTDYEKIAPTVLFNVSNYNSLEERVTEMGEILNRLKEAKAFLNDMKNRVETMRKKVLQAVPTDATFTIINSKDDKNATLEIEDGGGEALYNLLGLSMPENLQKLLQDKDETRLTMSWETINDYAGGGNRGKKS